MERKPLDYLLESMFSPTYEVEKSMRTAEIEKLWVRFKKFRKKNSAFESDLREKIEDTYLAVHGCELGKKELGMGLDPACFSFTVPRWQKIWRRI